jgi:flavin reductase (DIM6/NTAB) family NADH-FMN oxidoreductase RutF
MSGLVSPYIRDSIVDSPVAVVLVEAGNRRNAMTISCFSEVAHYPAAIWISVAKTAYSHDLIREAERFSVAVLSEKQRGVALTCGTTSGRSVDKCRSLDLYQSPGGFLFLRGALASTGTLLSKAIDVGDHTMFLGNIVEAHLDSRASRFRHLLLSDLTD